MIESLYCIELGVEIPAKGNLDVGRLGKAIDSSVNVVVLSPLAFPRGSDANGACQKAFKASMNRSWSLM